VSHLVRIIQDCLTTALDWITHHQRLLHSVFWLNHGPQSEGTALLGFKVHLRHFRPASLLRIPARNQKFLSGLLWWKYDPSLQSPDLSRFLFGFHLMRGCNICFHHMCLNSHVKATGYTCLTNVDLSLSYDTHFIKAPIELPCSSCVGEVNGVSKSIRQCGLLQELLDYFGINLVSQVYNGAGSWNVILCGIFPFSWKRVNWK